MSCCGGALATSLALETLDPASALRAEELMRSGRANQDGTVQYVFSVPDISCGRCMATIETALAPLDGVVSARVNLTMRRVTVVLDAADRSPLVVSDALERLGYGATPVDIGDLDDLSRQRESAGLLKALAVAGFAAGNIMLLSVSVWSGADAATRDMFHLVSALIALPAVAYSGQVFFRSAFGALRAGRLNMDVPISLAVVLALAMSVFESLTGGAEAYFDAAVTLLFFLLIGRYLDQRMRERARTAVTGLSRLAVKGASRVEDGELSYVPLDEVRPGMILRVAAGERVPVDGVVVRGTSDLDRSLVTGESAPFAASSGDMVEAGTLNLSGSIDIEALATAENSFLAEIIRMMDAAEKGRGRYVRVADRMARIYAPAVHILAAATFVGWLVATGGDWYAATYAAIAVLIITCPCALGLAVPVVHVIGAARLFENGILMKDGSALERLAEADHVVFDKTGTLTTGVPRVTSSDVEGDGAAAARALAAHSTHPASRAILAFLPAASAGALSAVHEVPGCGVEGEVDGRRARLGRSDWVGAIASGDGWSGARAGGVGFALERGRLFGFELAETLRGDAAAAIDDLKQDGLAVEVLSGDAAEPVARIAGDLGVVAMASGQTPGMKIARLRGLQARGAKVLMVGDGLNDAPSLAAGDVSMAPASACDAGRLAADFVFTRDSLFAVPFAHRVAVKARRLVQQNFALAILYNCIAVPLAMAGYITPLGAAIAMSSSSIVVVANSLRLARGGKMGRWTQGAFAPRTPRLPPPRLVGEGVA
ncbi:heavy metal translocating P-type ATPase [Aurantimonas sp. C2-6-R+9]|uniref:heavy metal translocating P-type ATPase n=1 Tax=unclassified Aurantimonas TaxID=2638230 RepID=UPI002E184E06|nr:MULTISPECIES: heavy metal translocating P-type ATPase [unclassified Aurantimonas]MEC5291382.1 heavy metal translocating P-type ATPase [Aurantimonas sp. C2-3-R2]MEC5381162.1 heavy metal translocating P-type ATPase [Aurantimonas sp. C2-6-R+9]MEC5412502.1 heavy metal translocating P-type ATPase [Aurantimonas sp. C2-4-R8]